MSARAEVPPWLVVGAEVAIVWRRYDMAHRLVRVERFTPTRVVLSGNAGWFPLKTLTREAGGTWGWTERLAPLDDPDVSESMKEERLSRTFSTLIRRAEALRRNSDADEVRVVAQLALAYARLLEEEQ